MSSAGVALIIIALIESRQMKKSLDETSNLIITASSEKLEKKLKETSIDIIKTSSEKIDKKLEDSFKILENCRYNGLYDILPPKHDETRIDETKKRIAKEIEKTELIYVLSISGLDFFGYPRGSSNSGIYYQIIAERLEKAGKGNKPIDLKIKALLMEPTSKVAEFRTLIEATEVHHVNIKSDVATAIEGIKIINSLFNKHEINLHNKRDEKLTESLDCKSLIEYRCYSEYPQAGFILTDSYIFVELYHFAPTEEFCNALKEKNLLAANTNNPCTGGRIPVFQFGSESNMYIAMKKHFDSIWKESKTIKD